MRLIFGVMSLLIVLAIVGTLGKKQFEALGLTGSSSTAARAAAQGSETKAVTDAVMGRGANIAVPGGMPGAVVAPVEGTLPAQSRGIQNNVRSSVDAAVQQGAANRAAQEPK